jgi:inhibitor of cysteine peptidase
LKRTETSVLCFVLIAAVLSGLAVVPFYLRNNFEKSTGTSLLRFSSFEELKSFVKSGQQSSPSYYELKTFGSPAPLSINAKPADTQSAVDFSRTNIQVEGVDELDIVKADGEYVYAVSGRSVLILKAYPAEEARVLSKISLNGTVIGVFISGDRLIVIEAKEATYYAAVNGYSISPRTFVRIYNVSDRTNPVSAKNVSLDGDYSDSRMIGDYVYTLANRGVYEYAEENITLPKVSIDSEEREIPATEIYYPNVSDYSYTYTTIAAVNVQKLSQEPVFRSFMLGWTRTIYVSSNNIYLTFPDWGRQVDWGGQVGGGIEKTSIHRIHIENDSIEYVASGSVPGSILNQFSMDEYNGYFRVATTSHVARVVEGMAVQNNVYILDMDLKTVGALEDLAAGENIHSARFMSNRCYLVTFKKVDPLFVIDLENPYRPSILGYLKVTGYSDYLHPYNEKHVIGIGKETVAAEEGDFAWYQGVKISLFDVTDVENPTEIAKFEIGDRGTDSPVLRDQKAFLFDKQKSLLALPVLVAKIDPNEYGGEVPPYAYGHPVWQGAYVFNVSLTQGLALKGRITHLDNASAQLQDSFYSSSSFVKRILYIGNVLYTVSDKMIKMNSLEDLREINKIEIP